MTIIVLLILAGVSIATLTGQGNILENANNSRQQTDEAVEEEKVKVAVSSARINGQGNLTTEILQNVIGEQFGEDKKENLTPNANGSWTFKGVKSYDIDAQGVVKVKSESLTLPLPDISSANPKVDIGTVTVNGTELLKGWQYFYNDGTNVYLIYEDYLENDAIPTSGNIASNDILC